MNSRQANSVKKTGYRKTALRYGCLLLGSAILAFALYNIHKPSNITEGGVLGMTLLLDYWFGISPSISGFILDICCYLIAFRFLGRRFAWYSLVASGGFALFYGIFEQFPPLLPSMAKIPVPAAVLGGVLMGAGVGLIVRVGGASGGDDALAMAISHISGWKIAVAYLFTDLSVLALSLSYLPMQKVFCSLITVMVSSYLIDSLQSVGRKKLAKVKTIRHKNKTPGCIL